LAWTVLLQQKIIAVRSGRDTDAITGCRPNRGGLPLRQTAAAGHGKQVEFVTWSRYIPSRQTQASRDDAPANPCVLELAWQALQSLTDFEPVWGL
jgi:hypothetical protein